MKNNSFFSSAFSTARLFFAVNVLAGIGFNIGVVGVGWFIIASTGSNQLLGLYGALSLISAFITLAAAGAVMDKYAPLTLLCGADGHFLSDGAFKLFPTAGPVAYLRIGRI